MANRVKDLLTVARARRPLALVTQPRDVYRFSLGALRAASGARLVGEATMTRLMADCHGER
ncbi:hypothetical protein CHELA20_52734 [Hyphomicrobiales bacterium]|nr:hypothetical protein CHELA20_52734 [Hyphomicrobiales bacterium]